ncbi:hypothetical protein [Mycolicibacterium litorale]|uniref:3-keto-disaccharide hydrolase domain-containing protein n=1 Tax=Mycolicibacterium litorale TaxID=758802 RepID=A0AAD1IP91_9MYCO|nr:hypothetical protein [Mycolicibacterium litorale]TDY06464.1 hypothetical protein BCL50_2789 [Mycolicibacterium litorale]BBY19390.1 hypothetical protein MLIT_49820 [Mycolicibacterium litorale]
MVTLLCATGCASQQPLLEDSFAGDDASSWVVTSGTLLHDRGEGWTGIPDDGRGEGDTGSAVFRMVSVRRDFTDIDVSLRLDVERLVTTARTPAQHFDGAHIWVRYQSERQLYAVSVDRRDATMIIKKKCAGGESNGGRYLDLSAVVPDAPIPFGRRQQISVAVRDQPDGSVMISADRDGHTVTAIDSGVGCPPLRAGGVGIRGDNAELRFDDLRVTEAD